VQESAEIVPPFQKGQSGNPAGKLRGTRNRTSVLIEELLLGEAKPVTEKVIELAKAGDMVAIKLVLDRLAPPRRDQPIRIRLPRLRSAADAAKAMSVIAAATASGRVTPDEGAGLARLMEAYVKTSEAAELEQRVAALEERMVNEQQSEKSG
jgi:uncharacterized protein YceH (UPF0502 family)